MRKVSSSVHKQAPLMLCSRLSESLETAGGLDTARPNACGGSHQMSHAAMLASAAVLLISLMKPCGQVASHTASSRCVAC
jgi:hypothetical protein